MPFSNEIVPAVWHYSVAWARLQTRTRAGKFRGLWFRRILRQFESGEQGIRALGAAHSGEERCQTVPYG